MALNKGEIQRLYRRRAARYDLSANLYYLIGFRESRYRKQAVAAMGLHAGNTAVDIGCGTGLNFPYLISAVGEGGKLIGLDLTDAMLQKARARAYHNGWKNIELVTGDAALYEFPVGINGVISSFALTLIPEFRQVLENAYEALASGGKFVVLDLKRPEHMPLWLVKAGVVITSPFGVSLDLMERRPWEVMRNIFPKVTVSELYGGFAYIAVGERSPYSQGRLT